MGEWQKITNAPKDGIDIDILTAGGFEMKARWEQHGFENAEGKSVGAWVASEEEKHPPCWTDGACWESNADEVQSDPPIMWRPPMTGEKMKGFFNSLTPKQQEAALAYDGPENFGFPMTGENTAPAEMPGVEEIADLLQVLSPIGPRCRSVAARILDLFAPILAEKERVERELAEEGDTGAISLACWQGAARTSEARALAAEAAVLAVAPYVDSIVCYASTIDTHDGNRVAKLVNEAAAAIRAQGE